MYDVHTILFYNIYYTMLYDIISRGDLAIISSTIISEEKNVISGLCKSICCQRGDIQGSL